MNPPLRLGHPSPLEKVEPYVPFLTWPVVWIVAYGWWTWAILYAPDVLLWLFRRAWDARHPTTVTVKRSGAMIVLEDGEGRERDRFELSEVDSLTSMLARNGVTRLLRVERRNAKPLLFVLHPGEDMAGAASQLGLDLATARSRYAALSPVARQFVLHLGTVGSLAWSFLGDPAPETALWLARYIQFIGMPVTVLSAIPTVVDVGRDGVAWRWLFLRHYVPYRVLLAVESYPKAAARDQRTGIKLCTRSDHEHVLLVPRHSSALVERIETGLALHAGGSGETSSVETWLPRGGDEPVDAWVRRLRAAATVGGGYRGVSVEHLWTTAEDGALTLEARCGAWLVLSTTDAGRGRIIEIARDIVDPKLRETAEAIGGDHTDEKIAKLIEAALR
jgi:hypothetical protein